VIWVAGLEVALQGELSIHTSCAPGARPLGTLTVTELVSIFDGARTSVPLLVGTLAKRPKKRLPSALRSPTRNVRSENLNSLMRLRLSAASLRQWIASCSRRSRRTRLACLSINAKGRPA
jgi:hypothetical protein